MTLSSIAAVSCVLPAHAAGDLPRPQSDLPAPKDGADQTLVVAGGCFWCVEGVFEKVAGVKDVVSGYAGGTRETANYEAVCTKKTDHAEVVKITYDPSRITFGQLLHIFFTYHDPTTLNAQGPDHGRQYRSAIFFENEEQKKVAAQYIKLLEQSKSFSNPIVTTLEPLTAFYPAEAYHQDYVRNHPTNAYIQRWAMPKVKKLMDRQQAATRPSDPKQP